MRKQLLFSILLIAAISIFGQTVSAQEFTKRLSINRHLKEPYVEKFLSNWVICAPDAIQGYIFSTMTANDVSLNAIHIPNIEVYDMWLTGNVHFCGTTGYNNEIMSGYGHFNAANMQSSTIYFSMIEGIKPFYKIKFFDNGFTQHTIVLGKEIENGNRPIIVDDVYVPSWSSRSTYIGYLTTPPANTEYFFDDIAVFNSKLAVSMRTADGVGYVIFFPISDYPGTFLNGDKNYVTVKSTPHSPILLEPGAGDTLYVAYSINEKGVLAIEEYVANTFSAGANFSMSATGKTFTASLKRMRYNTQDHSLGLLQWWTVNNTSFNVISHIKHSNLVTGSTLSAHRYDNVELHSMFRPQVNNYNYISIGYSGNYLNVLRTKANTWGDCSSTSTCTTIPFTNNNPSSNFPFSKVPTIPINIELQKANITITVTNICDDNKNN